YVELDEEDKSALNNDPVSKVLSSKKSSGTSMAHFKLMNDIELGARLRVLPLTEENKRMFDQVQANQMPSVTHQFACESCDRDWWRCVIHLCYDPVPANIRWGIAEFNCPICLRTFKGFGRMDGRSPCRSAIFPTKILPPRKRSMMPGPRSRNRHSCHAEDCYNRMEPHVPGTKCVHPHSRQKNRKPRVVYPSSAHSSGSTVNTCLSQPIR
uniref:Shiftless antiviral inhibitor of ribosomal frameshifting n=1 Tax=Sinocyclocheilus grahami TaxID=75366 RepID=A0A672MNT8_SINGR